MSRRATDALQRNDIKDLSNRPSRCANISEDEYSFALDRWRAIMSERKILQGQIRAYIDRYGFKVNDDPEDLVMR